MPGGELGVGALRAAVGELNGPEQRLLEPIGVVVVELLVRLAQAGECEAEGVGRLGDGVEQVRALPSRHPLIVAPVDYAVVADFV
jgi:hypothetical protein